MKIPLAWLQLKREKIRLLVALIGISFADILMLMQLGFRSALFESATLFHRSLNGEIVLISSKSVALIAMSSFSERLLYQAISLPEVENVSPIYLGFADWKIPQSYGRRSIFVIGFNPDEQVMNLPGVQQNLDKLKTPDTVLFDQGSSSRYGPVVSEFNHNGSFVTEVNDHKITTVGLFTMGPSFGADGNLITSDLTSLQILKNKQKEGLIHLGLIKLKPGVKAEPVIAALRAYLPKDIRVFSKQEYIDFEQNYWNSGSVIGFIFAFGLAIGFLVGTVIIYQILYSEVSDHLPEYATLKAIGYTDNYLLRVVFQEALILAILGYFPGYVISYWLYKFARSATMLPMTMTVSKAMSVLLLSCLMCTISGAIAALKLRNADPADIF